MDNFINMAQKGYAAYEQSQNAQQNNGQQTQHQEGNQQQNYQQGSQNPGQDTLPVNHGQAAQIANAESGSSGNNELFSQAMAYLSGGNHSAPVNEQHITDAHKQVYDGGDASNVPASAIGSAAALQTLKSFMSSGGSSGTNSGGDFQTKMIGMAMSEASQMFDKTGNQGDKQDAVNGAASTMFKLLVQSKMSGGGAGGGLASLMGGSDSGGLSSMLKMASQFTK